MCAHRIRLRAPWRVEVLDGGAHWTRRFHRPTHLARSERVRLVVAGAASDGTAQLNGQTLGPLTASAETRFDITALLAQRNELALVLSGPSPGPDSSSLPAEVFLDIG